MKWESFHGKKVLSIVEQDEKIKRKFPQFKRRTRNHKKGIWVGKLSPTEWSPRV